MRTRKVFPGTLRTKPLNMEKLILDQQCFGGKILIKEKNVEIIKKTSFKMESGTPEGKLSCMPFVAAKTSRKNNKNYFNEICFDQNSLGKLRLNFLSMMIRMLLFFWYKENILHLGISSLLALSISLPQQQCISHQFQPLRIYYNFKCLFFSLRKFYPKYNPSQIPLNPNMSWPSWGNRWALGWTAGVCQVEQNWHSKDKG